MPIRSQFETEQEWLDHLHSWFAGQALIGIVAQDRSAHAASLAYALADAMLAERAK